MKIILIGDVGASGSNLPDFCSGSQTLISEEIRTKCKNADIVILNLEKPLTDQSTPLGKCPPDYIAPTDTINGLKLLNPTVAVLANNHILDQREQGLYSTIQTLQRNGIKYVGAGETITEAKKPVIIESAGFKVGIYACCEKEFSGATDQTPGANVFDPLESFDDIEQQKLACDYLVVLFHGGMQGYPYPTPYQQKVCRKMCDKGADMVVCQHSHIVGCEEQYKGSRIIYGQGNFLLDEANIDSWKTGLMIEVDLSEGAAQYVYTPVQTIDHTVRSHEKTEEVLAAFHDRSDAITGPAFVDEQYSQLCREKLPGYLMMLSGKRRIVRRVLGRLGIHGPILGYDRDTCNMILDYFNCDAHREAIITGLSVK